MTRSKDNAGILHFVLAVCIFWGAGVLPSVVWCIIVLMSEHSPVLKGLFIFIPVPIYIYLVERVAFELISDFLYWQEMSELD